MQTKHLALAFLIVSLAISASSAEESRPDSRTNPIRLEGQIREITSEGNDVVIRLHRDRYPLHASRHLRVRRVNGPRIDVGDLQTGDSIRVEGDLQRDVVRVDRITLLQRIERR